MITILSLAFWAALGLGAFMLFGVVGACVVGGLFLLTGVAYNVAAICAAA